MGKTRPTFTYQVLDRIKYRRMKWYYDITWGY